MGSGASAMNFTETGYIDNSMRGSSLPNNYVPLRETDDLLVMKNYGKNTNSEFGPGSYHSNNNRAFYHPNTNISDRNLFTKNHKTNSYFMSNDDNSLHLSGNINNSKNSKKSNDDKSDNSRIVKMPYNGTWSMISTQGFKPIPRICNCYVYEPTENIIFIAYGQTEEGKHELLGDSWILHLDTFEWECVSFDTNLSARCNVSAVLVDRKVYMFGGQSPDGKYFADLHVMDLDTRSLANMSDIKGHPVPRSSPTMFTTNFEGNGDNTSGSKSIIVWGGYNGETLKDLYEFDIKNMCWKKLEDPDVGNGRRISLFASNNDHTIQYALSCHSNGDNIIQFDQTTKKLKNMECTGHKPRGTLNYASMAVQNNFLFVVGGKHSTEFTYLYALNLETFVWFKFYVVPDNISVTKNEGAVDDHGLFQLPRINGQTMIFSERDMALYAVFGNKYFVPCPVQKIELSSGIALLNHRSDMKYMLNFQ